MSFHELGLSASVLRAVDAQRYSVPTPIQCQAIPHILAGRDLLGCAQTGTGKTAAFALPILDRLTVAQTAEPESSPPPSAAMRPERRDGRPPNGTAVRPPRGLVLAPTRELAAQIGKSFTVYGQFTGFRAAVIFGGVSQFEQVRALQRGVDLLVATPGRLLDLMQQGYVKLNAVEFLILDEADQMLDMGFLPALKRIVAQVPERRQTLLFSATMPVEIRRLAEDWLRQPVEIKVAPAGTPAELVAQSVVHVDSNDKARILVKYLLDTATGRTLVFTRTKHGADKVVKHLERSGIRAAAIHGNKSQNQRLKVLAQFKSARPPVLVATDVAARGLDIHDISHVVNFDMPLVAELYVHRIGRTGRAGGAGVAVSFCARDERNLLRQIERLIRRSVPITPIQAFGVAPPPEAATKTSGPDKPMVNPTRPARRHDALPSAASRSTRSARVTPKPHPASATSERSARSTGKRQSRRRRARST